MAYIGTEPTIGNFQVCDAISVVNGQAAYTMQVSSVNVTPESANHMLVSLNGILQKPNSSFTISGSTITFASNLATGDVIDFIMILGNVLDLGVPSDSTVTDAKANFVSTSSGAGLQIKGDGTTDGTLQLNCSQNSHGVKIASPAHSAGQSYTLTLPTGNVTADKFLKVASISGSGTTATGQLSFADAGGGAFTHLLTTTASDSANVTFDSSYITTTYLDYMIVISGVKPVTDNVSFRIHLSVDNGSNYLSSYRRVQHARNSYGLDKNTQAGTSGQIQLSSSSGVGANTLEGVSGVVKIFDPMKQSGTTDIATMVQGHISMNASDNHLNNVSTSNATNVTTAINNIKVFFSSGNIESGKISLYGRKVS